MGQWSLSIALSRSLTRDLGHQVPCMHACSVTGLGYLRLLGEDLSRMHVCLRLTQARPPCAVRAPSKHVSVAAIPSTPPVRCEGTEQARKRCAATHWVDAGARACVSKMTTGRTSAPSTRWL